VIVVDTSALIAILLEESEAPRCEHALAKADGVLISAGTLTEAYVVAARRGFSDDMADLVGQLKFQVVPVDVAFAEAAGRAYARYGRGLHAASLNFGDSFAYVLAKRRDLPLLFIGRDFSLTDIASALP
jgi:ribonuclease VapC